MTDPTTPEEWQLAADAAQACLEVEAARQYGLIEGGPTVNVDRCIELLARARAMGIEPCTDGAAEVIRDLGRAHLKTTDEETPNGNR